MNTEMVCWSCGEMEGLGMACPTPGMSGPLNSAGPEAGVPERAWEAGAGGQRRAGTRVDPGGSGQEVGERTGFAHIAPGSSRLGPDNSSQVVDFPHLSAVRVFLRVENYRRAAEAQSQAKLGTNVGKFGGIGKGAEADTDLCGKNYGLLREVSRKFAMFRTDQARNSAMLRIVTGKAYFLGGV